MYNSPLAHGQLIDPDDPGKPFEYVAEFYDNPIGHGQRRNWATFHDWEVPDVDIRDDDFGTSRVSSDKPPLPTPPAPSAASTALPSLPTAEMYDLNTVWLGDELDLDADIRDDALYIVTAKAGVPLPREYLPWPPPPPPSAASTALPSLPRAEMYNLNQGEY